MSLFDTFDPDSEEILKPSHMIQPVEGFPETVFLTFEEKSLQALQSGWNTRVAATLRGGRDIPVYALRHNGRELAACQSIIGGAGTAGLLEEALALGAKKVLIYGSCGVLDAELAAGHFILPTQAYRDEGVSYHYLPVSDYVDIPTAQRLGKIFDELNLPYVKGRVWTTDAIYRETRTKAAARRGEGCVAVEMECASLMAAGRFRGRRVYQFLYAEDSLAGAAWEGRTWGRTPESEYERLLKIALETGIRLS